jgi:hypothetical protein
MVRWIFAALIMAAIAISTPALAMSQGELEYFARRIDNIRDPGNRRIAQMELEKAREALKQNNAAEFKQRGDNIVFIAHADELQWRR